MKTAEEWLRENYIEWAQVYPEDVKGFAELLEEYHQQKLAETMPSETIKGVALYNELKGITKVELALSDNCYMMISEYLHSKGMIYPVKLSKSDVSDLLLEFLGVIDRRIKSLSTQEEQ